MVYASIREHLLGAAKKLVFDCYHLMAHLVKAADKGRKEEPRELKRDGSDILTGTKYLWLYSRKNFPAKKRGLFSALGKKRLRTVWAWVLKESLRDLWA